MSVRCPGRQNGPLHFRFELGMVDDVQGMLKMGEGHCFASFLPILFLLRPDIGRNENFALFRRFQDPPGLLRILQGLQSGATIVSATTDKISRRRGANGIFGASQLRSDIRRSAGVEVRSLNSCPSGPGHRKLGAERPERVACRRAAIHAETGRTAHRKCAAIRRPVAPTRGG